MKRRLFLGIAAGIVAARPARAGDCTCAPEPEQAASPQAPSGPYGARGKDNFYQPSPWQTGATPPVGSKVRITDIKIFPVTTPGAPPDRPYIFVKILTDAGVHGWGEATLEGKAGAVIGCINDFREYLVGSDPIQVEHHWQSMYVHSFYRPGPVAGSAISGIDQALWDIRGKLLGMPVYALLGGPVDARGIRGYYGIGANTREQLARLRENAVRLGITCFKTGVGNHLFELLENRAKIESAVKSLQLAREVLGPDIDIACDFHAKTSPTVASVIIKEIEPLNLLFVEEPCPPENIRAMARIARRSTTPLATGERLVGPFACQPLIEMGVVDILQTDISHVGGISALWKVGAMAGAAGISMAPHNCEGPIGGIATLHVDAAMPNFLVQEVCSGVEPSMKEKIWEEWLGFPAMRMVNGYFPLTDKPGLGIELSEDAFKKYPFTGARPMARVFHEDGSVAEW